jgi:hypothetical protein
VLGAREKQMHWDRTFLYQWRSRCTTNELALLYVTSRQQGLFAASNTVRTL